MIYIYAAFPLKALPSPVRIAGTESYLLDLETRGQRKRLPEGLKIEGAGEGPAQLYILFSSHRETSNYSCMGETLRTQETNNS